MVQDAWGRKMVQIPKKVPVPTRWQLGQKSAPMLYRGQVLGPGDKKVRVDRGIIRLSGEKWKVFALGEM